jgi:hypothetical protein
VNDAKPDPQFTTPPVLAPLVPLAPALMMVFWMLLGASAGTKLSQSLWQLLGWGDGEVSIAVPVGGAAGAAVGAVLGRIKNPRLLVLLMAAFAGSTAGGVAGQIAWGRLGRSAARSSAGRSGGWPGRPGCSSGARGI